MKKYIKCCVFFMMEQESHMATLKSLKVNSTLTLTTLSTQSVTVSQCYIQVEGGPKQKLKFNPHHGIQLSPWYRSSWVTASQRHIVTAGQLLTLNLTVFVYSPGHCNVREGDFLSHLILQCGDGEGDQQALVRQDGRYCDPRSTTVPKYVKTGTNFVGYFDTNIFFNFSFLN